MDAEIIEPKPVTKSDAVNAWMDASTAEQKRAAVKQFPILVAIYSEASNYQ